MWEYVICDIVLWSIICMCFWMMLWFDYICNKWLIMCLFGMINFASFFYYSAYFCYYSWAPLYFLILFMGPIILFQLTFAFIYNTFNKKFSVSENKWIPNRPYWKTIFDIIEWICEIKILVLCLTLFCCVLCIIVY